MAWLLLKIEATDANADDLSDALMDLGALSASIEDAYAETDAEEAIFGEPGDPPPGIWQRNIVTAMFDNGFDIKDLLEQLKTTTGISNFAYHIETIEEQDWVRATQSQFDPICITPKLWIVPTWHKAPVRDAINIVLDPGLAFGTGSHPTTHLCLQWLSEHDLNSKSVLDYGCGSGILAIAAKKLCAAEVVGVDIDEQAVQASIYNAQQNQVAIQFDDASRASLGQFDIVVANILSSALMVLAPILAASCKTGGQIALSGILEAQVESLLTRYGEWFNMNAPKQLDAWILLTGTKK
ncbi:MAG TPA: 50S ribosomal protein L11 methyltransferase [Methylophilus sp.]|nr:50S ribosomal protein L11 methyltransferase [Methylophilus sp.]HQQ32312.1 50S ribosomal protein L11 methyltransferase [Methylophilus sp.]